MEIGFIGLGDMGQLMAKHLLDNHRVWINNRTKSKSQELVQSGAIWCDTPDMVAEKAEIIILMLADDQACNEMITGKNGILKSKSKHLTIINMSTITPKMSIELDNQMKQRLWNYIEAPVSGTLPHAKNKQLIILVAGKRETFENVKPTLGALGRRIDYFGKIGNALKIKLIINSILAVQTAILAETLTLAEKENLDPTKLLDIINDSALGNVISKVKGENMIKNKHDPLFKYRYIVKDLDYTLQTFNAASIQIPLINSTAQVYLAGLELNPDLDFSAISEVYQNSRS